MRSDVVITPPGSRHSSRPSSRQGRENQHHAGRDQPGEPALHAAHEGYSRSNQPPSRMRPMDPERVPLNTMPDSARPLWGRRHSQMQQTHAADHASRLHEDTNTLPMGGRAQAEGMWDVDQPAARVYAAAAAAAVFQGLPPGEPRLQGGLDRGRPSRRGSIHGRDRSRSQDDRGLRGHVPESEPLYPDNVTSDGYR